MPERTRRRVAAPTSAQVLALPYSDEAERSILGSIILANDLLARVEETLGPSDFYRSHHRTILAAMKRLRADHSAIDFITLCQELSRTGELESVGGRAYITSLVDGVPRSTNIDHYIRVVKSKAALRASLAASERVQVAAASGASDEEVEARLIELDTVRAELRQIQVDWGPPAALSSSEHPAFPSSLLPAWVRDFVESEAEATQTPVDLAGGLALAVCSATCARKMEVVPRPGWMEPLNIFHATVLPPGTRKSAVFRDCMAPLEAFEQEECDRTAPLIAEAEARRKILDQRIQRIQGEAAGASDDDRDAHEREVLDLVHQREDSHVPAKPRFIVDDCSPERLATLLRDQGGRIAAMSPEGDLFDLMAGRYSSSGDPNLGVYLKGHAGDTLRVDRVGRPPEFVFKPALTIGLAVQPAVLQGLASKPGFRGRGLLGRFLYSLPPNPLGTRKVAATPVPTSLRGAYANRIRQLLALPYGTDEQGRPTPHTVAMTTDARGRLEAFERWIEPQLGEGGELAAMTDWAGKLAGAVVRLAGILHAAICAGDRAPWSAPIDETTIDAAIGLGRYFLAHAQAAYAEIGADPDLEAARFLLAWIRRKGVDRFSKRDAFEGTKGRFKRVEAIEGPLALLVSHEYIRPEPAPMRVGPGRRPSPRYDVNPLVAAECFSPASSAVHSANSANSANTPEPLQISLQSDIPNSSAGMPEEVAVVETPDPGSHYSHYSQNPGGGQEQGSELAPVPSKPCYTCHDTNWWGGPERWICGTCHPPAPASSAALGEELL